MLMLVDERHPAEGFLWPYFAKAEIGHVSGDTGSSAALEWVCSVGIFLSKVLLFFSRTKELIALLCSVEIYVKVSLLLSESENPTEYTAIS